MYVQPWMRGREREGERKRNIAEGGRHCVLDKTDLKGKFLTQMAHANEQQKPNKHINVYQQTSEASFRRSR